MKQSKITILDGHTTNPGDLSWEPIAELGQLKTYDRTPSNKVYHRAQHAEVVIVNKTQLDWYMVSRLRKARLICAMATGYNNIDVQAATHFGITVCNAVGYSSPSVAQHVFSLLLEMTNHVGLQSTDVQAGGWTNAPDWCYWKKPMIELAGKTMGIYGLGKIGQQVAQVALGFGMKVIAHRRNMASSPPRNVEYVPLEQLFSESDILSLHAPLTTQNTGIINTQTLSLMKPTAYLINTGRGGLVNEMGLKKALENGKIAGAGLDVLSEEPPPSDHPLMNAPNCVITPHQAWATRESRSRLIQIVADNIRAFFKGKPQNVVNG